MSDREAAKHREAWIILYDDQDREQELFYGFGATEAARQRYEQVSSNWNCHLFERIAGSREKGAPDPLPEPKGCPTPGACSCIGNDPRDQALRLARDSLIVWAANLSSIHPRAINEHGLKNLDRVRSALAAIDQALGGKAA